MKVIHLSRSDIVGGAARAAYRIHKSLINAGIDSSMYVNKANSGDWMVNGPNGKFEKGLVEVRPHLIAPLVKMLKTSNPIIHSPSILPSNWVKIINSSDADIVHLHWVQHEMLSIADIGNINKPVVWTLHDMWAFCGAEHLAWDDRWREGYRRENRPNHESGFDLNRWTWKRKINKWKSPMYIVTPSRWLANFVSESFLMKSWPLSVIANPIDTDFWSPIDRRVARELLGLPLNIPLLAFGSFGANSAHHKGFDLLLSALENFRDNHQDKNLELVIFGECPPEFPPNLGFPVHYTGHLHDDFSLRALYSSVDAVTIPSRQDNLPNVGVESQSCGTPVVGFNIGGLPDIVEHLNTGYLAKAFDTDDLANGFSWAIDRRRSKSLSLQAREKSITYFSKSVAADKYLKVYKSCIKTHNVT